jgi:aminoglycoside phosphotransferase family enzyme/predicted kinase
MDEEPGVSEAAAIAETHSAIVVFIGDRAYKIKKPVDLGFLDFSTVAARREAANREVDLNRRLAPDVYLGVADIIGPDGAPCDHAVVMRRMPNDRRLSACLSRGENVDDALRLVARDLAALHDASPRDPAWNRVGSVAYLSQLWEECFAQLERQRGTVFDPQHLDSVETLARRYLAGRQVLFEGRIATGRIRDCHGDLQADDIFLLPDGPRILDCIEFSDELRWGDELNDFAFLAMDLERLGHPELADRLLAWQREFSTDSWPASLAHHYIAYRAIVRAKVASIRHEQGDARAGTAACDLVRLATAHLEHGRVQLVLIGGLPGTGKSTIARTLAERLPFAVLRTDEMRERPAGALTDYGEGRYAPDAVAANYRSMLDRAGGLLRSGESVVLDGSWSSAELRSLAEMLASSTSSDLIELCCTAPSSVTHARIAERIQRADDPSEATPAIADQMADAFDAWPSAHLIDTSLPVEDAVALAVAIVHADGRHSAPPC